MLPVIALAGRPNVGKSTLFNRITGTDHAIVSELSGLTRDRQYGLASFDESDFILIDAGGITDLGPDQSGIDALIFRQSKAAIEEADLVILVVDGSSGLHAGDEDLVQFLRKNGKHFCLAINKVDGHREDLVSSEFFSLGVESLFPIAAKTGRGVKSMLGSILIEFNHDEILVDPEETEDRVKLAVIGRPNVGKSTLINSVLGDNRLVVYDQPGTTRDCIYVDCEWRSRLFTIIDTAGARRRSRIDNIVEKYSIAKTLQAISNSHVVLFLFDGTEGVVDQDLNLLSHCIKAGRGLVLVVNKWDEVTSYNKALVKSELSRRLIFADFADLHYISALRRTGIQKIYKSIEIAYKSNVIALSTPVLNKILKRAQERHPPPMISGRRIKLRYAHAGGNNPQRIIIHGNQTDKIPLNYLRYLEKYFRSELELWGAGLRLEFRSGKNPYEEIKNRLTLRQLASRRRMMRHVKKGRKKNKGKRS